MYKRLFVLRDLPLPRDYEHRRAALLRFIAESLGLARKGADVVLDVLDALFYFNVKRGYAPTLDEVVAHVNKRRRERGERAVAAEAVRYHIRRMEDMGILERSARRNGRISFRSVHGEPSEFIHLLRSDVLSLLGKVEKAVDALIRIYSM